MIRLIHHLSHFLLKWESINKETEYKTVPNLATLPHTAIFIGSHAVDLEISKEIPVKIKVYFKWRFIELNVNSTREKRGKNCFVYIQILNSLFVFQCQIWYNERLVIYLQQISASIHPILAFSSSIDVNNTLLNLFQGIVWMAS
jgi:hypothetical protein